MRVSEGLFCLTCCRTFVCHNESPRVHLKGGKCPLHIQAIRLVCEAAEPTRLTRWFTPSSDKFTVSATDILRVIGRIFTNSFAQRQGLPLPSDNNDNFPCVQNSGHTHGQGHTRNSRYVVIEETRVGKNSIVRECLDSSSRCKR